MSIRTRLIALSIVLALVPLGIAGWVMIRITRDELKSAANDYLSVVAKELAGTIDDFVITWLTPIQLIKESVESDELAFKEKRALLTEGPKSVNSLAALQISVEGAFAPFVATQEDLAAKLRAATNTDPVRLLQLPQAKIDALKKPGQIVIGDLIRIPETDTWLATVIMPIKDGTFPNPATLSARIDLDRLKKNIVTHLFNEKGSITLVDPEGRKLFDSENLDLGWHKLVQKAKREFDSEFRNIGVEPNIWPSGEKMLGAYAFPDKIDIGVIVEMSEYDAYQAVAQMEKNLIVSIMICVAIAVAGAIIISFTLTRPLLKLTRATGKISQGDFSPIEGKERKDEIGKLSSAFNDMLKDLRNYIEKLGELEAAKKIQKSFLPTSFPEFDRIEIWGTCESAKEVGGDYFDYFQIDPDHFGMVIGDVSDKGVKAALYMAQSRALFRTLSAKGGTPDKVLYDFNEQLVALDQGANMFITLFYGVYNLKTGRLAYSTAGHNMPYLKTRTRDFQMLPAMKTMVAGIIDGMEMNLDETSLASGDIIVLYTDGMTEAVNEDREEFGEERLKGLLDGYADLPAKEMCDRLIRDVFEFQTGMPQFDDMTLFVLKVR